MHSRRAVSLFAMVAACSSAPEIIGSDPGRPFAVHRVVALDGFAYAAVSFKSEHDRTDGPEGIVVVDMKKLFVANEPLSNGRINPESETGQNVFVWQTGSTRLHGRLGRDLVASNGIDGGVVLQLYEVTTPTTPVATIRVAIPSSQGAYVDSASVLDDTTVALMLAGDPGPRLVVVRPRAPVGQQIVNDLAMPDGLCATLTVRGTRAYCVATVGVFPVTEPNLRVYAWSGSSGLGEVVQSVTVDSLVFSTAAYASGATLVIVDRGVGNQSPSGLVVLDLDEDGLATVRTKLEAPTAGSGRAMAIDALEAGPGAILLATLSGAFVVDAATGEATGSATELVTGSVKAADGLAAGHFVASAAAEGLTLYRVEGGAITRVATYGRKWGDRFPNYGSIFESRW